MQTISIISYLIFIEKYYEKYYPDKLKKLLEKEAEQKQKEEEQRKREEKLRQEKLGIRPLRL